MFGRCFDATGLVAGCAALVICEMPKIAVSSNDVVNRLRANVMGIGVTEFRGLVFYQREHGKAERNSSSVAVPLARLGRQNA